MTKLDILKETYEYYTADVSRRGYKDHGCFYKIDDKMCAVGRCMTEKAYFPFRGTVFMYNKEYNLEASLKEEYRGHEIEFWKELQTWHDDKDNWDKSGLTVVGQKNYDELLRIHKNL